MAERSHTKKQFMLHGIRMRASLYKTKEGGWKIFSIGGVDLPTALLPFEVQQIAIGLVRRPAFATKEAAFGALVRPDA